MISTTRVILILVIFVAALALPLYSIGIQAVQPQKPAAPAAAAEDCGCDEAVAPGPQVWAVFDGTKVFDTDVKSAIAAQIDPLLKQLKDMRQQGLEDLVNSRLIDKEARAAGVSRVEFIRQRVDSKLPAPTDADIQAFIDKNKATLNRDPKAPELKREVAQWIIDQNRNNAFRSLGLELRKKYQASILPEVGTNTDPTRVVAIVDQVPVRRAEWDEAIKGVSYNLKMQIFNVRKEGVDRRVNQLLLEKEAVKRGMTLQTLFSKEVLDKAPLVTVEQTDAYYQANKSQYPQPLEQVRSNLMIGLRQQYILQQEQRLIGELRKNVSVSYSIPGVTEPVFSIGIAGKPTTGAKDAPVTIVEFSDYQCPVCGNIQPLVKQVLALYPAKIRLVAREFPLMTIHAFARKAAQAAQCAFEQGKYWEFTALLYKNQTALDESYLMQYAALVGMDKALLAAHLKSGLHDKAVQEDLDEGMQMSVSYTPTFFINGRRLEDRSLEGFKQAIDKALAGH